MMHISSGRIEKSRYDVFHLAHQENAAMETFANACVCTQFILKWYYYYPFIKMECDLYICNSIIVVESLSQQSI